LAWLSFQPIDLCGFYGYTTYRSKSCYALLTAASYNATERHVKEKIREIIICVQNTTSTSSVRDRLFANDYSTALKWPNHASCMQDSLANHKLE